MVTTARSNKCTQFLVHSCFIKTLTFCSTNTILSLAQRVRSVSIGHTCGYMDVQSVQHSLVPPGVTPDAYIFVRVHLLRSIGLEPLFNQNFHSLFPCDLFATGECRSEATQTSGDDKTTVVATEPMQTVDEIYVQQRVSTIRDSET